MCIKVSRSSQCEWEGRPEERKVRINNINATLELTKNDLSRGNNEHISRSQG